MGLNPNKGRRAMKRIALAVAAFLAICIMVANLIATKSESNGGTKQSELVHRNVALQANSAEGVWDRTREEAFSADDADNLLEELLKFLPPDVEKQEIFYDGEQLVEVEGRSITEDPVTGILTVSGLTTISWTDGRSKKVHGPPDPRLRFDPSTGQIMISANYFTDVE